MHFPLTIKIGINYWSPKIFKMCKSSEKRRQDLWRHGPTFQTGSVLLVCSSGTSDFKICVELYEMSDDVIHKQNIRLELHIWIICWI